MLSIYRVVFYYRNVDPVIFQEVFSCSSAFLRGGSARSLLGDWVNLNRPFWALRRHND